MGSDSAHKSRHTRRILCRVPSKTSHLRNTSSLGCQKSSTTSMSVFLFSLISEASFIRSATVASVEPSLHVPWIPVESWRWPRPSASTPPCRIAGSGAGLAVWQGHLWCYSELGSGGLKRKAERCRPLPYHPNPLRHPIPVCSSLDAVWGPDWLPSCPDGASPQAQRANVHPRHLGPRTLSVAGCVRHDRSFAGSWLGLMNGSKKVCFTRVPVHPVVARTVPTISESHCCMAAPCKTERCTPLVAGSVCTKTIKGSRT